VRPVKKLESALQNSFMK